MNFDFFALSSTLKCVDPVSELPLEFEDSGYCELEFASELFGVGAAGTDVAEEGLELGVFAQESEKHGLEPEKVVAVVIPIPLCNTAREASNEFL